MTNEEIRQQEDSVRLKRINRSPIYTDKPFTGKEIIYDNLESGVIKIYEQTHNVIFDKPMFTLYGNVSNGIIVAEATINPNWQNRGIFIHKISWSDGYESFVKPVIDQILDFSNYNYFYACTGISKREYEKCLPYAGKTLTFFKRKGNIYEYCTDEY